jgi:glucose-1-phosphate adenylyltransferase
MSGGNVRMWEELMQQPRPNNRLSSQAMAFVLAGGRGSRLKELTDRRAKPAVYFGGKTRIIDFALSNALNSGIRKMAIATQYKAHSLIRHVQRGWGFLRAERNEYLDILPASQRMDETNWYRGTADAVAQNIDIIDSYNIKYVVVLAGDHIYKMDYEIMLQQHVSSGADVTIGCLTVPKAEASAFGVMHVDADMRITSFLEKPKNPPTIPGDPAHALASMGIYVFDWTFLRDLLMKDMADDNSQHDFGMDLIPAIVAKGKAIAHKFEDSCVKSGLETEPYWRDVGTIDAFWQANVDLTDFVPKLDLYDNAWPIWTYAEIVPPAKFIHDEDGRRGSAVSSLVSGDCIVSGSEVRNSLLFTGVRTHSFSSLEYSVVLPYVTVHRSARLTKCVIDRGVIIPEGLVVGEDAGEDTKWFRRTDSGIVLITQDMLDARAAKLAL